MDGEINTMISIRSTSMHYLMNRGAYRYSNFSEQTTGNSNKSNSKVIQEALKNANKGSKLSSEQIEVLKNASKSKSLAPFLKGMGPLGMQNLRELQDTINNTKKTNTALGGNKSLKLSSNQIKMLKSASGSGLLTLSSKGTGFLGTFNSQESVTNHKLMATLNAYKRSI
ncbi:hypothetical protein ACMGD3_13860 [Lysinibacillus sphaericus]|uniref:hypothetical protein n=1 Tax=Lysinibacillus sphaericus TaxID=1421 RepID=UPI003F79ACD8